jgi:hypothetical protein
VGYAVARALSGRTEAVPETAVPPECIPAQELQYERTTSNEMSVAINGTTLEGARLEMGPDGGLCIVAPLQATLKSLGLSARARWRRESDQSVLDVRVR